MIAAGYDDEAVLQTIRLTNNKNAPPLPDKKLVSTLASIRKGDKSRHPDRYDDNGDPIRKYTKAEFLDIIEKEDDFDTLTVDILRKIHQARLPRTTQEVLLKAIKQKTGATLEAMKGDMRATAEAEREKEELNHLDYARDFLATYDARNVLYCEGQFLLWRNKGVCERVDDRVISRVMIRTLEKRPSPPRFSGGDC